MGSYLVGSFVFLQFLDWCASRDFFSGDWAILAFRFLALLLPSAVLLAWRFGRPGPDQWRRVDKIAVPANVLAAVALVGFMALGMPFLRAGQTTVTVEDEEGNAIERVVPTERLRQRLAVFFFDNDSGDPALDDLVQGLGFLVQYDLSQDQVMSLVGAQQLWGDLWRVSPEDPLDIPPAARRELAEDFRCPHYVSGAFARTGEDWSLTTVLHDTRTSRERARHAYRGPDLFALVDQATVDLRRDLGVPEWHLAETPDLPVADITSRDPEAFRDFMRAVQALMLRNDYGEAERHGLAAVEQDPRFGLAWFQLMQIYANGGQPGKAPEAMARAMDALYSFPERMQFLVKATHYVLQGEPAKREAVLTMWTELYPQDLDAVAQLGSYHRQAGDYEKAIAVYRKGLETDDYRGNFLLELGELYSILGRHEEALAVLDTYIERYPESARGPMEAGDVYRAQGRYEEAWARYERVVLLEPDNTDARLRLADLRDRQGRFGEALALLDEAEREAVTVVDRAAVLADREALLRDLGRLREAIAAHERANALRSQYIPPVSMAFGDIELMALHIHLGDTATGLDVWRARRPLLSNLYADANGFYRCIYGVLIEDPDTLARGLDQVRRFSDAFGADPRFLEQMNAELLRLQGRPAEAAERYGAFLDSRRGQVLRGRVDLAELHRRAGALDRARTIIDEVLEQQPRYSFGLLEAAEIALADGRQADARRHLEALMEVWAGADAAYGEARRATALLAGLANG